jgi:ferredoxin
MNVAYQQHYVLDVNIIGSEDAEKAKATCPVDAIKSD